MKSKTCVHPTFVCPRLPFDSTANIFTYSIASFLELAAFIYLAIIAQFNMGFFVESFVILSQFAEDIQQDVSSVNEDWETNRNQVALMEKLGKVVWFNNRLNELSSNVD